MHEEPSDIEQMQQLLDRSLAKASEHLQSIIRPDRAVPAGELVERLTGMRTLALSTVSPAGRPRISGVDGHLLRGRPAVSAAYLEGDTFGVFTHGEAEFLAAKPPRPRLDREALRGVTLDLGTGHRRPPAQPALDGRLRRRAGRLTRVAALMAGSARSARAA